ncbi:Uncharacterized protein TCAP_02068 [Tolypocladium capitatum]|uniref:alpha-galactosidase n=1 Tax=Tolypocladium capitatum TaxID=45235 RepID=A0A2K3QKD3_9HYPO|nr:Uncharacterized protein TCAP_02068 [Tolypocladium capitatum]
MNKTDPAVEARRPKGSFFRTKKFLIAIAVVVVIVIALAVGLGVGLTRNREGGDDGKSKYPPLSGPPDIPPYNVSNLWQPAVGTPWQIILKKPIVPVSNGSDITPYETVYDLDMADHSADTFAKLRAAGISIICYFSAGSWENWRSDKDQFPAADLGKVLNGWPNEKWLNVSSPAVRDIMKARIKAAASKGCTAIDPDNVDGYDNDNGLGLTGEEAADYVKFLATEAASYNMSTGLKNAGALIPRVINFVQFSVNEQCIQFAECKNFKPFIDANKPVFNIEYPPSAPNVPANVAADICSHQGKAAYTEGFSTVIKTLDLMGWVQYCDGKTFNTSTVTTFTNSRGASS